MGGSSSKSRTTNKYNTTIVNNNDLDLLNQNVNNFVSNTVIDQASKCSSNITQLQNINISKIRSEGDFSLGDLNQTQKSAITFDCVQLSAFKNDIANGVLTQYMDAIKNSYDASTVAKMISTAQSKSKNQFGTTGNSKSSSDSNNEYNFSATTNVDQNIQNVVKNAITNNMKLTDMQDCMSQVLNSQTVNVSEVDVGGKFDIRAISQNQAAEMYAKCIQEKNNGNNISTQVATDLGLQVTTEVTNTSSAEMQGGTAAESANTGVFQSMGEGLASLFKGIGEMWGTIISSFGFKDSNMSLYCFIALIIFAVLGGGGYYLYNQNSEQGDEDDSTDQVGGALFKEIFVKFDTLKFIIFIMVFVVILQIYKNQNN